MDTDGAPSLDGVRELAQRCSRCKKHKPVSDYDKSLAGGWKRQCRACLDFCARKRADERVKANRELAVRDAAAARVEPTPRSHATSRVHMHGNVYDKMFREQRGLCASCWRPERETDEHGKIRRLVAYYRVDGGVKGLICASCTSGFHSFCDSPAMMARALMFQLSETAPGTPYRMEITG
jgi:hypothetical protein